MVAVRSGRSAICKPLPLPPPPAVTIVPALQADDYFGLSEGTDAKALEDHLTAVAPLPPGRRAHSCGSRDKVCEDLP